ncbi:MAG: PIG-L deacetylase family protein [Candidatus Thorarchaeota archaeon]|jgi:LmbE family N-acetylglucosaminyl deacetylase
MKLESRTALFLSAHADDAEFGCGGIIQKLVEAGVKVTSMVFSICEDAVDTSKYPKDIRRTECKEAAKILGIQDLRILNYPVRRFNSHRQEILQDIIDLRSESEFELVFTHWHDDVHQDHQVVAAESYRAFKGRDTTLLSYEIPLNCQAFSPNVFIPLSEAEVEKKIEAIWCYISELERRSYFQEELVRSSLGYRGPYARTKYAEAFELKIMIVDGIGLDKTTS